MELEERTIWHYAVFMARSIFMEPCCMIIRTADFPSQVGDHGMSRIRGDVNCENCKKAMGMPSQKDTIEHAQIIWCVQEDGTPAPVHSHGQTDVLEPTAEHLSWIETMIDEWYPDVIYFIGPSQTKEI